MREDDLDDLLRAVRDDTAPVPEALRVRIVAEAGHVAAPSRSLGLRGWLGGLIGVPGAALLGLWLGAVQPALVFDVLPETQSTVLLDEVFGAAWMQGDAG